LFGGVDGKPVTSLFGDSGAKTNQSLFGAPKTSVSLFGAATTAGSLFGASASGSVF
jgi:hypothetical protein